MFHAAPVRIADPCLRPGRQEGDAILLGGQVPQHAVIVSVRGVGNGVFPFGLVLGEGEGDGPGMDETVGEGLGVVEELGELARVHTGDELRGRRSYLRRFHCAPQIDTNTIRLEQGKSGASRILRQHIQCRDRIHKSERV